MRPRAQLGIPFAALWSGMCSEAKSYGDHSHLICLLSYRDHRSVLLIPQCLEIIVSCMLSTFLVDYGRRGNLVTVTPLELEVKVTAITFYLKYCNSAQISIPANFSTSCSIIFFMHAAPAKTQFSSLH